MEGEWLLSVEGRVRLTVRVAKERVSWSESAKIATRMRVRLHVRKGLHESERCISRMSARRQESA